MAQTARCPSCGAPVEFKSAASVLAVCDYCRSTLIRQGEDLANLGRMAALLDDRSPLQRGAEGVWRGRPFGLIGRIQLRYEQGLWNEWHLLFDDGKSGWLSEAGDEYVMSELKPLGSAPPPFANLEVGQSLRLNGRPYTLTNLLKAECVGGEGELPFKVGAGYPAPVADLRDEAGGYATLDYSESEERPIFFEGEAVDFESLRWNNLRQDVPLPNVTVQARAFDCPSCGAPLKVDHTDIKTIGCGSCGALLDPRDERVKLLERASDRKIVQPTLALGTKGKLRGEDVEIVGYMRRRMRADRIGRPLEHRPRALARRQGNGKPGARRRARVQALPELPRPCRLRDRPVSVACLARRRGAGRRLRGAALHALAGTHDQRGDLDARRVCRRRGIDDGICAEDAAAAAVRHLCQPAESL